MANLNSNSDARDEGNWDYLGWSPRITSTGAMDTFVGLQLTRANAELRQRVGLTWYAANVAVDPWATILKEAEMHLAQSYLLVEAAAIAETGGDTNPAPFLGSAATVKLMADQRMGLFERCVQMTRGLGREGEHLPVFAAGAAAAPIVNRYSPLTGDPNP